MHYTLFAVMCVGFARRRHRSGVGSFHWEYDHFQEVTEKLAERVIHRNSK